MPTYRDGVPTGGYTPPIQYRSGINPLGTSNGGLNASDPNYQPTDGGALPNSNPLLTNNNTTTGGNGAPTVSTGPWSTNTYNGPATGTAGAFNPPTNNNNLGRTGPGQSPQSPVVIPPNTSRSGLTINNGVAANLPMGQSTNTGSGSAGSGNTGFNPAGTMSAGGIN